MSFVNSRDVQIEWGDCDPAGIVFYPRYFAMFDWSTASLFAAALGEGKADFIARHGIVGIPMVDTRARFVVPSRFGDRIRIESTVEKFGRTSFDVKHRVLKGDRLAIEAWEVRVWAGRDPDDSARIKGVPIPHEVVAALS